MQYEKKTVNRTDRPTTKTEKFKIVYTYYKITTSQSIFLSHMYSLILIGLHVLYLRNPRKYILMKTLKKSIRGWY